MTGVTLLERYGMTEAGMILSQPYMDGSRVPGSVGFPLPGVDVEVLSDGGEHLLERAGAVDEGLRESGLLLVRGKNVFTAYLGRENTSDDFRGDWFVTGDRVTYNPTYAVSEAKKNILNLS